jgi:flagellar M-ring protein FliF
MPAVDVAALRARALGVLKGFSPSQLVIIGLLGVVAVVGGSAFLRWASAPTYAVLLAGLEAEDAAAVTEHLESAGVPFRLEGGGSTVLVPKESVQQQRLDVAAAGLPAGRTQGGWAAFDEQGLTSSSFQQQVAYQRALESTLASSLMDIDGVSSAQVHLALPEKRLFTEDAEAARASVLVASSGDLSADTVDAMTHLVSSAVPGLAPEDVSVTDSAGRLLTGDGGGTGSDKALRERQAYEDALVARVNSMFATLIGPGRAVVRVSAEIDRSDRTVDTESFDKDKTAVLSSTTTAETYETAPGSATAGGAVAQPSASPGATASSGSGYEKSQTSTVNGVTRTVEHAVVAPGGVKRLTVAVAVDRNAKNAPPVEEITSLVSAAVGLDPARGDSIAVTTPAFLMPEETTQAPAAAGAGPLQLVSEHGPQALGALLLLLVAVGLLRTVRRGVASEVPAEQLTAAIAGARAPAALPASRAAALPAGAVPAPRSEADVLDRLDESPDELAGLLRGWLAHSGGER